jgi:hypothetical protein
LRAKSVPECTNCAMNVGAKAPEIVDNYFS